MLLILQPFCLPLCKGEVYQGPNGLCGIPFAMDHRRQGVSQIEKSLVATYGS